MVSLSHWHGTCPELLLGLVVTVDTSASVSSSRLSECRTLRRSSSTFRGSIEGAIIRMQDLVTEQLHLPWLHRRRDYPNAGPCDGAAPPSVAPRKAASTHYPHMAMIAMLLLFNVMIDLMNGRYNV